MELSRYPTRPRALASATRKALAALLLLVALIYVLAALATQAWQPELLIEQVVDLDAVTWGRAGAVALALLLALVARALARGKRQAWLLSLVLLCLSLVGAILERSSMRSIVIILIFIALLVALAPLFTTRSDLRSSMRGYAALAVGGWVAWGRSFLLHVLRANHIHFLFIPSPLLLAPLRVVTYLILAYGVWQLLRPALAARSLARDEHDRAATIVRQYGAHSTVHFALAPDKSYFFSASGRSLIAYRVAHGVALALADPIGPAEERTLVLDAFLAYCRRQDWPVALYQATPTMQRACRRRGLFALKIGEDALVDLGRFTLQGKIGAPVRHAVARARRGGLTVRVFHGEQPPETIFAGMRRASAAWLGKQEATVQFGFSMGRFPQDWSPDLLTAVALGPDEQVQAFVTWTPLHAGNGWALDNIRRESKTEPGAMELLLAESVAWAQEHGCARMTLGLVPLAGLEVAPLATDGAPAAAPSSRLLERSAAYLHRHGLLLGAYRSLYAFKNKFQPEWEARYLVVSEVAALPQILSALAFAMGIGWRGMARDTWDAVRAFPLRSRAKAPTRECGANTSVST